jgi:murein DD-endopeptidase MepM/ murein hydrolase activator NlpD
MEMAIKLLSPTEKEFVLSQGFGPSDLMMYGKYVYADRFHYGNDFACPTGTQIRSSISGIVVYAKYNDSYGNNIIVEKDGLQSRVAHLSEINVIVGQYIEVGQNIGLSGNSGIWTNGPHLHWDINENGVYFDGLK